MDYNDLLGVTEQQALQFFFSELRDIVDAHPKEVLYNASILAHDASTATQSSEGVPAPVALSHFFDQFVLAASENWDRETCEAAAEQCLLLTGFCADQADPRHSLSWY